MGLLKTLGRIFKKAAADEETKKRLADAGVSTTLYGAGAKPGLNSDTKAEVREKSETVGRLREEVQRKHQVVREKLRALKKA